MIYPSTNAVLLVGFEGNESLTYENVLKKMKCLVLSTNSEQGIIDISKRQYINVIIINSCNYNINYRYVIKIVKEINKAVVILLVTDSSNGRKFSCIDMLKNENIDICFDKADSTIDQFEASVLSIIRICNHIQEIKEDVADIAKLEEMLSKIKEDEHVLLEHMRLAMLGKKIGKIFHDMANHLVSVESSIYLMELICKETIKNIDSSLPGTEKILQSINKITHRCKIITKRIQHAKDMNSLIIAQSRSGAKFSYISVQSLIEKVTFLSEDILTEKRCSVKVLHDSNNEYKICGREVNLVHVLSTLISFSAKMHDKGGGEIVLRITEDDTRDGIMNFEVRDSMGDIPLDIKEKICHKSTCEYEQFVDDTGILALYTMVHNDLKGEMSLKCNKEEGNIFSLCIPGIRKK